MLPSLSFLLRKMEKVKIISPWSCENSTLAQCLVDMGASYILAMVIDSGFLKPRRQQGTLFRKSFWGKICTFFIFLVGGGGQEKKGVTMA